MLSKWQVINFPSKTNGHLECWIEVFEKIKEETLEI